MNLGGNELFKRFLTCALVAPLLAMGAIAHSGPAEAASARCWSSGTTTTCYNLLSTKRSTFRTLFTDGVRNPTGQPAKLTCSVSQTVGYSATVSTTVSAGVKAWVIAHMDASVSASITASVSVTRGTTVEKTVPAHTVLYCDRGVFTYVGSVRKTGSSGQHAITPVSFTVRAPSAVMWQYRQRAI